MSDTVPTAVQPALHPANVTAHPGSTWAGVGVGLVTLGQTFQAGGLPTTSVGWVQLLAGLSFSIMAALGK
jgi:hypothetical protein